MSPLQPDCQEPGSALEPYAQAIEYGLPLLFLEVHDMQVVKYLCSGTHTYMPAQMDGQVKNVMLSAAHRTDSRGIKNFTETFKMQFNTISTTRSTVA